MPAHERLSSNREAIPWGYGHFVILGSAAAIGAGIEVAVEHAIGKAHVSTVTANASVTVPAALYLLTVWLLHSRHFKRGRAQQAVLPVSAVAVLACTYTGTYAVLWTGLVAALTVAAGVTLVQRSATPTTT